MRLTLAELLSVALIGTCILKEVILTHHKVKFEKLKYIEAKINFITKRLSSKFFNILSL